MASSITERARSAGRSILSFGQVLALGGLAGAGAGILFALLLWMLARRGTQARQIEVTAS